MESSKTIYGPRITQETNLLQSVSMFGYQLKRSNLGQNNYADLSINCQLTKLCEMNQFLPYC